MPQVRVRFTFAGMLLVLTAGVSSAQTPPAHDAWLMQNYHFTGPPSPSEVRPVDPVLTDLRQIQETVRTIMRRAKSEGDYEAALAAASQAVANAQVIGAVTEHQEAVRVAQAAQASKSATVEAQLPAPLFLIAMKDKTINAATSYSVDGPMLSYVTLQGIHVIVRLDLVDRGLSRDLNRQRNVEFHLPE